MLSTNTGPIVIHNMCCSSDQSMRGPDKYVYIHVCMFELELWFSPDYHVHTYKHRSVYNFITQGFSMYI